MKQARYKWVAPIVSGVTLMARNIVFFPGKTYLLPCENSFVRRLVQQGHLEFIEDYKPNLPPKEDFDYEVPI